MAADPDATGSPGPAPTMSMTSVRGADDEAGTRRPVAVVTGGSAGVGRAVVRALADHGYDVGILARGATRLEDACRDVEQRGGRAIAVQCDVSDAATVETAAERIEDALGPIDVWVNNAMASVFAPAWETAPEEYRRVTEVTYLGYVHGTLAALRRMRPRDRGTIVQVGSTLAYRGIPLQSAYCGGKHAVVGFTDSLRTELIHEGSRVRLTAVHLPAINTPQFRWVRSRLPRTSQPVPPIFQPEVAARAILHAIEHPRRELLVGWPTVLGVLGQKLVPGWMDVLMARVAWSGQMTDAPWEPRPDNLDTPVDGHEAAHGPFDDRAYGASPLLWAAMHRRLLASFAVSVAAGIAAAAVLVRRADREEPARDRGPDAGAPVRRP
jgi:NAD(P)-dependent dehydrogenase (short-subunit alcohol dehydrogenase family)